MQKIDTKDRRILSLLDMNARMPITTLAKKTRLSRQVVEYRINRMQKNNVIFGALTIFDSAAADYNWYRLALRLHQVTKEEKEQFLKYLENHPRMMWLGEVGGNWDIVFNIIAESNTEFDFLFEQIVKEWGKAIMKFEVLIYINVYDMQRNYILEDKKIREDFFHPMKVNKEIKLDETDWKIIKEISKNARKTNVELGQKLGISRNTIKNRIDNMIKNKLILGFRLIINPAAFGMEPYMLFLATNRVDPDKEQEFYQYLKSIPYVSFITKQIGRWRFGIEIEAKDEIHFQDIFVEIRGRFSELISDYETFPIFKDRTINYFPLK